MVVTDVALSIADDAEVRDVQHVRPRRRTAVDVLLFTDGDHVLDHHLALVMGAETFARPIGQLPQDVYVELFRTVTWRASDTRHAGGPRFVRLL